MSIGADDEPAARVRTTRKGIVSGAYHHHLVTDDTRVTGYARAVAAAVREGDVVADLGAGSGLLSGLAVRAGARRVYAVDHDPHAIGFIERFARENGLQDTVTPVDAEAESWTPPEPVDVVLCEMMETGLMNEDIVRVMNHVARAWPHRPRAIVPEAASLRVVLARARADRHGFRVLLPHFERSLPLELDPLSEEAEYALVDFRTPRPNRVDDAARLTAGRDGEANAVVLVTRTLLGNGVEAPPSSDHASPLVLPLEAPLQVRTGERWEARVRHELGSVTGNVSVELRRAE